ncbi:FtsX-like permease family protein [Streptomyces sp. NPDC058372]|uniref:FtsX-like permease family protein n=1 Tax=Streptomyces sp. NPDC058372 TaxID=3346464 RepID=UPI003660D551
MTRPGPFKGGIRPTTELHVADCATLRELGPDRPVRRRRHLRRVLVSMIEQLRERRRVLAALAAFGTRRRTPAWSVLWRTAIPVTLGIALAVGGGLGLGAS